MVYNGSSMAPRRVKKSHAIFAGERGISEWCGIGGKVRKTYSPPKYDVKWNRNGDERFCDYLVDYFPQGHITVRG